MSDINTYFVDENGTSLGSSLGLLPVTLKDGMIVTIHGHSGKFAVVDWSYHHGHPDENPGLTIKLRQQ